MGITYTPKYDTLNLTLGHTKQNQQVTDLSF